MKIQRKVIVCSFLSILFLYAFAMDPEKKLSEGVLWKQLKQKISIVKELKSRFSQEKMIPAELAPRNFIPQSLIHLKTVFGREKKEDELIDEAINSNEKWFSSKNNFIKYKIVMNHLGENFKSLSKSILANETKYWNYYVFYHGQADALVLVHDIMYSIYSWFNLEAPNEQTRFLRLFTESDKEYRNIDEFLESLKNEMSETISFDHLDIVRKNLLSTNLSLFGNSGEYQESTWYYFSTGMSVKKPNLKDQLLNFFKFFNFNEVFIDKIMELHQNFIQATSQKIQLNEEDAVKLKQRELEINSGVLCQVFVHPDVVDEISYIAEPYGRTFQFDAAEALSLSYQASLFDNQDPSNKVWKKTFERSFIQVGKNAFDQKTERTSVRKYINLFRTRPEEIDPFVLDYVQARMYLKYSVITDPEKVKVITYKTPNLSNSRHEAAKKEYQNGLSKIIEEMIKDWLFKDNKRSRQKTKLQILFEELKMKEQNLHG